MLWLTLPIPYNIYTNFTSHLCIKDLKYKRCIRKQTILYIVRIGLNMQPTFFSITNSIPQLIIKVKPWLWSGDLLNPHGTNLGAHRIGGWVRMFRRREKSLVSLMVIKTHIVQLGSFVTILTMLPWPLYHFVLF